MDVLDNSKVEERKHYVKPQINVVYLIPKETVLGGCLTDSQFESGLDGAGCYLKASFPSPCIS